MSRTVHPHADEDACPVIAAREPGDVLDRSRSGASVIERVVGEEIAGPLVRGLLEQALPTLSRHAPWFARTSLITCKRRASGRLVTPASDVADRASAQTATRTIAARRSPWGKWHVAGCRGGFHDPDR